MRPLRFSRPEIWVALLLLFAASACSGGPGSRRPGPFRHDASAPVVFEYELTPKQRASTHYLKGLVARNDGAYEIALEEMRAAAALDPGEPRIRRRLVDLYVKAGNLDE